MKKCNQVECGFTPYHFSAKSDKGFTLIEMIVAVGLFAVVMLIAVGTLLSLSVANRKAQALQSVVNNLNISLDGMVRSIREGTYYRCGGGLNCTEGAEALTFKSLEGIDVTYAYDGSVLTRTENGETIQLTADEVDIESVRFYVSGAVQRDREQPKVMIVIKGTAHGGQRNAQTTFNIQATAVQRVLDI